MNSLLALLEDIAVLLDDIAGLTKVATKKTAGVLGDDLALNAEQVSGVRPDRELPVVWAVAKGSALNKLILVPAALAISALAPWAVTPLLMLGGAFLCFEGFEKVWEKLFHREDEAEKKAKAAKRAERVKALADPSKRIAAMEKERVKGAIRTDFILSAEILVISLGAVGEVEFAQRAGTLCAVAVVMTIGVYGLVAAIVKLDDAGMALSKRESGAAQAVGRAILRGAPWLMKGLGIAGTIAMFLVGGGIVTHGIPPLYEAINDVAKGFAPAGVVVSTLADFVVGVALGGVIALLVGGVKRLRKKKPA